MKQLFLPLFRRLQAIQQPLLVKIMVAMLIVTLIPLSIVGYFNIRNTRSTLGQAIGQGLQTETSAIQTSVTKFFAEQIAIVQGIALDETVVMALQERNASYTGDDSAIIDGILELDAIWTSDSGNEALIEQTLSTNTAVNPVAGQLGTIKAAFPEHIEVFLTDVHGATVGSTDRLSDYYQADEGWWQSAFAGGQGAVFISDPEFDESAGATAVLLAVPVFASGDSGDVIGVVRSTLIIDALFAEVANIRIGETGRAMLISEEGTVIAAPHEMNHDMLAGDVVRAANGFGVGSDQPFLTVFDSHENRELILSSASFGGSSIGNSKFDGMLADSLNKLDWLVIVHQASSEALAPVTSATQLFLVTFLLAVAATILVSYVLAKLLTGQLDRIRWQLGAVEEGDLSRRAEIISGDELGGIALALNGVLDRMVELIETTRAERDHLQDSIIKLLEEIADVADGDLTVEAEVTEDATGAIADSFNFMIDQLRSIIGNVLQTTLSVSLSANQIRATAEHLAQGSEAQASQVVDTTAAVDEMSVSIQQVSQNATQSAQVAEQALITAQQGAEVVQSTISGMQRIRQQGQETAKRIKRLGESSQEVGEIVQLIRSIAKRTSLLALNASLEAAAAGDAGRGFAVVAADVKRLAERSSTAADQITELIYSIQNETNEAVSAMEATTREVVEGSRLANEAGLTLIEIEAVSAQLAELIQSISLAATQQARGSETIAYSMSNIATVTQQTAVGTKDAATSISHLASLADQLRQSVSTFKIPSLAGINSLNDADEDLRQLEAFALGD